MTSERFTIDGSTEMERYLADTCGEIAEGIRRIIGHPLEALLLGGGYGRGEGGVLKSTEGDKPYNDLEFYVFVRGKLFLNERRYHAKLHEFAERASQRAGVEVEFKLTSLQRFRHSRPTMFSYDLMSGHRTLFGSEELFAVCGHHCDGSLIPLSEATRLLMNRCSGLLFAQERLQKKEFSADDADFVGRNHAKAQLGFGDVILCAHRQYHWSCQKRAGWLKEFRAKLPWIDDVRCHHDRGVDFKLHPVKKTGPRESFITQHNQLCALALEVWLWLENLRLAGSFSSARAYALSATNKCPETNPVRNALINLKSFGWESMKGKSPARYPRERLFETLALLLWEDDVTRVEVLKEVVQRRLMTRADTFSEFVRAYEKVWRRFN
jgi:hypothetical protein